MFDNSILIVDDMEINRLILKEIFIKEYNVYEASNGEEALKTLEEKKDEIEVILLDIYMPKLNGFEVLEKIQKNREYINIPVIMITGDSSQSAEIKVLDYGARDIILKPFDSNVIYRRVKNIIELYSYKKELMKIKSEINES